MDVVGQPAGHIGRFDVAQGPPLRRPKRAGLTEMVDQELGVARDRRCGWGSEVPEPTTTNPVMDGMHARSIIRPAPCSLALNMHLLARNTG